MTHACPDSLYDTIADALADQGYLVLENPLPADLLAGLLLNLQQQETALSRAGVGRQGDYQLDNRIRGDAIQWLEPGVPAVTEFLSWMDKLREAINQRLFLGLFDYESHYAVYEPGAFYQKHRDAFRGKPGRKLSTVLYLNPDWDTNNGGELVLYDEAGENELLRLAPEYGRLVLFLSEDFPHEVLPAGARRQSIAGWFRIKPL
ncbi:2OG-Fe(II) oxygenase [Cellvibrio sp. PSBB023]|uniref:2OG-Fe(II) oxygenase n=1 Tax=Cellvibrio sp. PSBB023 TaxID=1945512 RepID=UPI00098F8023|nr:2OG-Fe(II) oxygenase [Cellvibrio sp. PSBB023]AQT58825.1 2OG-Fe(II) oxygenase [Cellvibrio sp. PSBB023]